MYIISVCRRCTVVSRACQRQNFSAAKSSRSCWPIHNESYNERKVVVSCCYCRQYLSGAPVIIKKSKCIKTAENMELVAYSECEAEEHDQVLYVQQQLNVRTMTLQNQPHQHTLTCAYTCRPHRIDAAHYYTGLASFCHRQFKLPFKPSWQ